MTIGEKVKKVRQFLGLTQLELANAIGVTPITVSRWERNLQPVGLESLRAIARMSGAKVDDFYDDDGEEAATATLTSRR